MDTSKKQFTTETHPLLPSGSWNGFYTYEEGPSASCNPMPSYFSFHDGQISGGGSDSVGSFSWKGTYDINLFTCQMTKIYATHSVSYSGCVDENGIWGNWKINDYCTGGFHLWPKEIEQGEQLEEVISLTNFIQKDHRNPPY